MNMTIRYSNHAVERMLLRRISDRLVRQTIENPDETELENDGDTEHIRRIQGRKVHVIAAPVERGTWLIKTVWVDGEDDPAPIWKKLAALVAPLLRNWIVPR